MADKQDKKNKEKDPMYVDKKNLTMEEQEAQGSLHVANPEDSRVNRLDSESYEDHQQVYGDRPVSDEQPEDARPEADEGPAENVDIQE